MLNEFMAEPLKTSFALWRDIKFCCRFTAHVLDIFCTL